MDSDDRCTNLSKLIYSAYSSLHLYSEIAEHAKEINKNYGHFFGTVQSIAHNSVVLELCKIYELGGDNNLLSIPSLCRYISDKTLFSSPENFVVDARKIGIRLGRNRSSLPSLFSARINDQIKIKRNKATKHLKEFVWMREALSNALTMRNKHTAHAEIRLVKINGPSLYKMEKLLDWAEKFVDVVSDNFVQIGVHRNTKGDANRMKMATLRVFESLKSLRSIPF